MKGEEITPLRAKLRGGDLAVTSDITPPRLPDLASLGEQALVLAPHVDAIFVTESPGARPRVGSLAAAVYLRRELAIPVVLQLVARRSNRIALQSELLSAAAWGIYDLLLLRGDPATLGSLPEAEDLNCADTPSFIAMARLMRDEARLCDGSSLREPVPFLIGASVDPFEDPFDEEGLAAKLDAGVDFLVTQPVFDVAAFAHWLQAHRVMLGRTALLAGVLLVHSAGMARHMARVPGIHLPPSLARELSLSPDPAGAGLELACEIVHSLLQLPGLAGLHLMHLGNAPGVVELLRACGLARR
jgi:methylenetetrahydrofolate reductase (NADPH)